MEQCYICGPSQVQFEDLANAIIIQAADDYRKARKKLYKNPDDFIAHEALKEIEAFFMSDWYKLLTRVDGLYILTRLKAENPFKQYKVHRYWGN